MLGHKLKRFNYFLHFKKVLISFGLFGFLSPVEASPVVEKSLVGDFFLGCGRYLW